jgi:hypothetical protein
MNKRMLLGGAAIAALAFLLAACGGGYGGVSGPAYCGNPSNIVLAYPAPGATAVPNTLAKIYVAAPIGLGSSTSYALYLLGPGGGFEYTNPFTAVAASAVPTPAATPGFANPQYYVSTLTAALSPATEYAVYFNDTANGCTPNVSLGSFTTN